MIIILFKSVSLIKFETQSSCKLLSLSAMKEYLGLSISTTPIMLCCSALKIHLLSSILHGTCSIHFIQTVILECINKSTNNLSYDNCSIRVYRSFTTIFYKCLILLLIFALHFLIMLALCLSTFNHPSCSKLRWYKCGFLLAIAIYFA